VGKILCDPPASGCGAHVGPGELGKALPLIVDEVLQFDARAGFKDHDLDALLRKLVAERSAARSGADNHDHAAVIQIKFCHVEFLPDCSLPMALYAFGSQSMSAKPRLM